MSTYAYHQISKQIQQLVPQIRQLTTIEQYQLLADLMASLHGEDLAKPPRSILELEGLGQETWKGVDVEQYINQERDSWDG